MVKAPDLRTKILIACRIVDRAGLVAGYGHVSARLPDSDRFLITARKALGLIQKSEILTLNLKGRKLDGSGPIPYEIPMHLAIYRRRRDVKAVVRTHPPMALIFGALGKKIRPIHGFGSFLGQEVPVFLKPDLIHSPELGGELAAALGKNRAIILRGNGMLVTGQSVEEACVLSLFLEEAAQAQYRVLGIGRPLYYTEEEIRRRTDVHYDHIGRAWGYYAALYATDLLGKPQ